MVANIIGQVNHRQVSSTHYGAILASDLQVHESAPCMMEIRTFHAMITITIIIILT